MKHKKVTIDFALIFTSFWFVSLVWFGVLCLKVLNSDFSMIINLIIHIIIYIIFIIYVLYKYYLNKKDN